MLQPEVTAGGDYCSKDIRGMQAAVEVVFWFVDIQQETIFTILFPSLHIPHNDAPNQRMQVHFTTTETTVQLTQPRPHRRLRRPQLPQPQRQK